MRRFSDEVHVRSGALGEAHDAPVQFVWRGRLYVVRELLSRWRERRAWWEHSAVAAVHGDEPVVAAVGAGRGGAATTARPVLELGDLEREVFRVEASVGRCAASGVYDLARSVALGTAAVSEGTGTTAHGDADGAWQLLRVSD